jgi:two-component system phosphate regulon sensor histidine kinase PhoR
LTLRHPEAQGAVNAVLKEGRAHIEAEVVFEAPVRRVYQMQVVGVPKSEGLTVRVVVALHEITALKRAEDMRADFVANVSHELRSPLSTLTGFIETLQTSAKGDAQAQERFLGIMNDEAGRMTRLIDDLLSLSRIEVNEHIRPKGRVDVAKILDGVVDAVEIKAAQKGMTVVVSVPKDCPDVPGEADELRQVFQNLVDNAVNYGAADTNVEITARALSYMAETGSAGIEIAVRDQGEGISKDQLPRLTERFYRVDKGRSRAMGGTGLGLAIVKHIINRHRGRFLVESELGQGSVFRVELPANPVKTGDINDPQKLP